MFGARYDVLTIDCIEASVFIAPDANNPEYYWAVIDSDHCPWHEVYADDDFGELIRPRPWAPITVARPVGRPSKVARCEVRSESESDSSSEQYEHTDGSSSSDESVDDDNCGGLMHDVDLENDVAAGLFGNNLY